MKSRTLRLEFRKLRIRKKIYGTTERPRLTVFRSLKYIYAQIIDDLNGKTLVSATSLKKGKKPGPGIKAATTVGETLASLAIGRGIKKVVFDRSGLPYTGQIKALADAARSKGLEF